MNVFVIPDKFKGSLTSKEVSDAFADGLRRVQPNVNFEFITASDGGDGFLDAVSSYKSCISVQVIAQNPLGKPIQSFYLYHHDNSSAFIELAKTAGLVLLSEQERNPLKTTTIGLGIQIKDAIEKGAKHIYIGLGGSATNDAGIGLAHALGYRFLDKKDDVLHPTGEHLIDISKIDDSQVMHMLKEVSFYAVNDVNNPLYGKTGAAFVYAKQKGANQKMIQDLDTGLKNLDRVVTNFFGKHFAQVPGAGAAGGTAFGLKSFLNAQFISGVDFILDLAGAHKLLSSRKFDMIITGEGKIDEQTLQGKLMHGILQLGKQYQVPVLAVCGALDARLDTLKKEGLYGVIEIQDPTKDLAYNMKNAAQLLADKTAQYFQFLAEK